MTNSELLDDAFSRIEGIVHRVLDGISEDSLALRVDGDTNSIAWLIWHLARIQDSHIAEAAGSEQVWVSGEWVDRFHFAFDRMSTGYGHTRADVDAVSDASPALLAGYFDAVDRRTRQFIAPLTGTDLDRIVDRSFNPSVTLGVRLVSVISDNLQHAGQAAFVKGIAERAKA